ncbi:hypothetical protein AAHH79_38540, partial [Burkholderia pseudomallei]
MLFLFVWVILFCMLLFFVVGVRGLCGLMVVLPFYMVFRVVIFIRLSYERLTGRGSRVGASWFDC